MKDDMLELQVFTEWPCYCTVHVYVIHFCDGVYFFWVEENSVKLCLLFMYIGIAFGNSIIKGGWLESK
jgi:hypothetical protein